ncbi:MAG: peptidylprolyl isomerase [Xanthobacteraceae bacterium]|nr:peptidylprolyl isomerase [Xanthobacteraceae bacterium]MBX9828931.1 peptidylprolyl isomerase [Xanthobacteraceae bacterium]
MISLKLPALPQVTQPDARSRRTAVSTVATTAVVLALLILPVVTGCGQQSSTPSSSSSSSGGSASDPVIARVNGMDIRESDLAMAEEDLGPELQQLPPDHRREQIINYVADVMLAAQAAEGRNLQKTDEFRQREAFFRRKLLMGLMLQDHARSQVNEEALRKVYDEQIKPMGATEEVRARHILFRADPKDAKAQDEARARAQAALERIKKGEEFATVATELTEDPSGKENGGDLDYFTKDQMVPEFANIAFQMSPGQVSNPIRTQFGWHIIKLEDRRNRPVPEFEKVRPQIETFLIRRGQTELIGQLREKAKIERLDGKGAPAAKK